MTNSPVTPQFNRGIHKNISPNAKNSWMIAFAGMPGEGANYQDLLKTLAVFAMIIDHLGLYLFPDINELRIIGRYAMPIFVFFAGYNFKNIINLSVLFAGSLTCIISDVFIYHSFFEANILIPIFLGQIYLYLFRDHFKNLSKGYLHFVVLASLWPFTSKLFDYGTLTMAGMVIGYMCKQKALNIRLGAFVVAFISLLHTVTVFSNFDNKEFFFSVLVAGIVYLSVNYSNFEKNIGLNLRMISRHSMLIYCVHLLIIEFIWRYYIIS